MDNSEHFSQLLQVEMCKKIWQEKDDGYKSLYLAMYDLFEKNRDAGRLNVAETWHNAIKTHWQAGEFPRRHHLHPTALQDPLRSFAQIMAWRDELGEDYDQKVWSQYCWEMGYFG